MPNAANSAVRGALQGASLGWSDELAALFDAALPSASRAFNSDILSTAPSDADFEMRRAAAQEAYRRMNAEAQAENPKLYTASEMVGGLAAPVPFKGSVLKGLKAGADTATTAAKVSRPLLETAWQLGKEGAAVGALGGTTAGLGYGEHRSPQEAALDMLLGGTLGAGFGGVLTPAVGIGVGAVRSLKAPKPVDASTLKTIGEAVGEHVPGTTNSSKTLDEILNRAIQERVATIHYGEVPAPPPPPTEMVGQPVATPRGARLKRTPHDKKVLADFRKELEVLAAGEREAETLAETIHKGESKVKPPSFPVDSPAWGSKASKLEDVLGRYVESPEAQDLVDLANHWRSNPLPVVSEPAAPGADPAKLAEFLAKAPKRQPGESGLDLLARRMAEKEAADYAAKVARLGEEEAKNAANIRAHHAPSVQTKGELARRELAGLLKDAGVGEPHPSGYDPVNLGLHEVAPTPAGPGPVVPKKAPVIDLEPMTPRPQPVGTPRIPTAEQAAALGDLDPGIQRAALARLRQGAAVDEAAIRAMSSKDLVGLIGDPVRWAELPSNLKMLAYKLSETRGAGRGRVTVKKTPTEPSGE